MSIILENSPIMEKTKELCQAVVDSAEYNALMGTVESFLNNDEARLLYQNVAERSDELRSKQQAGVELSDSEIDGFKELRDQMEGNEVVMDFLAAQDDLQMVQKTLGQMIGMTLELGRVPSEEDMAAMSSGCCGGGCGDGGGGGG